MQPSATPTRHSCIDEPVESGWVHVLESSPVLGGVHQNERDHLALPNTDANTSNAERVTEMSRDEYVRSIHGVKHAEVIQHVQEISPFGRCGCCFLDC